MPNWTTNRLTVSGDEGEIQRFRSEASGVDETGNKVDLLLGSLVPEPDPTPLGNAPANGPINPHTVREDGGRAWRLVRWGTKWDVSDVEVEVDLGRAIYRFWTAWSAPLPWLREVSGLFPELVFEFEYQDEDSDEEEEGIYIECTFRNGEMVEADEKAVRDVRVAAMDPLLSEDPWHYYFFTHPEELERAGVVMSGEPPDEISRWVEVSELAEARLDEKLRIILSEVEEELSAQAGQRSSGEDPKPG